MSNLAIAFGLAIAALGPIGYFGATGPAEEAAAEATDGEKAEKKGPSPTAFIPTAFGVLLIVCGVVGRNEDLRKHAMHGAATVALLGFLMAGGRVGMVLALGKPFGWAATMVSLMAVLCVAFVVLCVRSFIAARKAMRAESAAAA